MSHSLTPAMLAKTLATTVAPVFFVEVDTAAGNVYAWSGYGNYSWNGQTWLGAGNLVGIGAVTEQNKIMAAGLAVSLAGTNTALVSASLADMRRYLPAKVWLGAIDDDFSLVADPYLYMNGRVDTAKIAATGDTATITVTVESRLIAMRNPKFRRYTDLDQRIEHVTDGGFSFVDTIQDASINFHG